LRNLYINPATNDLEFDSKNGFKMIEGDDELTQAVGITMKTAKQSWFLNPEHGFNRSVVQAKIYNEADVTDALYDAALQDERVGQVENIKFDYDKASRKLTVDYVIKKADGSEVEGGI
jgi:hypothetical protein